jgi:3-oxoacyl-[acyl-carrier protein] reductase
MDDIQGKLALVTGSAQGIGAVIAQELARRGARVLVNCAHSPDKAEAVCQAIRQDGGEAEVLICSVTDEAELAAKVAPRPIDILVNNARRDPYARPEGVSDGAWFQTLLETNLTGAYLAALAVIPGMKARRWGRILNMSSVQAYLGMAGPLLPYSVSKAGLHALTRCLAAELGDWGITVNTMAPGMVITENIHRRLSQETIDAKLRKYPIHRAATAEEVAEVAVNTLCCGAMTGEVVNLNSGLYFPA